MCILSIAVITWNRSKQLAEAIESCFACELPKDTEFIIIDNASVDDTEEVISTFFNKYSFSHYYEKMSKNLGVGRGRNYAFIKSHGKYVYFLDDDAYIDKNDPKFFTKAIGYLEANPSIVTLTSQIYDLVWQANRVTKRGPLYKPGLYLLYMFCGGSHFLRKSFWGENKPYFPNKYGYEEILPSLRVEDNGFINVFAEDLLVIHNPLCNKWNYDDEKNIYILINGLVCLRVMKSKLYPIIFTPMITCAYWARSRKLLTKERKQIAAELIIAMKNEYICSKRIKVSTVLRLWYRYGLTIF